MFGLVPFKTNGVNRNGDDFEDFLTTFFNDDFVDNFDTGAKFKADIKETAKEYEIEAELPGVKKEDIELEYKDGYRMVGAKREEKTEENNDNYIRKERHYGEFSRSFKIDNVDESNISAKFENGVLNVVLPKMKKEENTKKIEIK